MTALAHDPYRLPMPSPTTPVIPHRLITSGQHAANAVFADTHWPLAPMIENPSAVGYTIKWDRCPATFCSQLRLAAWAMINGELRPTFIAERAGQMRSRWSAQIISKTVRMWMAMARWLAARGITTLAGADRDVLHEYGLHLRNSAGTRGNVQQTLNAVTRLWAFDQLAAHCAGIARPPWDELGIEDYLPDTDTTGGENNTAPLAEATMGPLLLWAMRMVDDFAADILAGWRCTQQMTETARRTRWTPGGQAALDAYLRPLIDSGAPIPATTVNGNPGLARKYIIAVTGACGSQVDRMKISEDLTLLAAQRPGPCPLPVPVTGRIDGQPWRDALDFYEAPTLLRHLGTAAFIVCAYLTGMRPQEVLGMRAGCCPDPEPSSDGTTSRHLIYSREFKTALDEEGNHLSAGVERETPWVAIAPVVHAIRVLEQIVPPGGLLFDYFAQNPRGKLTGRGAIQIGGMYRRIADFAAWANAEAAAHNRHAETIPADPHGPIGTVRFRRTLAWHIARRPGGLVALAIQYGHLRTGLDLHTSESYGSRSRDGIHDLIDIETALATAQTAADLRDHMQDGGGVSGPTARQALLTAANTPRFEGQQVKTDFARKFVARDGAVLYDNPHALLICRYKADRALCDRDIKTTPSLDRCVRGCGNAIRTDDHAAGLRGRADHLDKRAALLPQPIGDRLRARAEQARADADTHDRTRITNQDDR